MPQMLRRYNGEVETAGETNEADICLIGYRGPCTGVQYLWCVHQIFVERRQWKTGIFKDKTGGGIGFGEGETGRIYNGRIDLARG